MIKTFKNYTQNVYNDNKTIDKILKFIILLLIIYLIIKYNILNIVIIILLLVILFILVTANNNSDSDKNENYINTTNFYRPEYGDVECDNDNTSTNGFNRTPKPPTANTMTAENFVRNYAATNQYTKKFPTGGTGFNPYRYGWNDINNGGTRDRLHNRWEHHSHEKNMKDMNQYMRYRR